jgi:hypothetical protein
MDVKKGGKTPSIPFHLAGDLDEAGNCEEHKPVKRDVYHQMVSLKSWRRKLLLQGRRSS